jgi:hypothetical protein
MKVVMEVDMDIIVEIHTGIVLSTFSFFIFFYSFIIFRYIDGTGKPGTSYQWCCTSLVCENIILFQKSLLQ